VRFSLPELVLGGAREICTSQRQADDRHAAVERLASAR
jgi:hypothetical protein